MPLTQESATRKDRTTGTGAELQHRHFSFIAATLKASKPEKHWDKNKMAQWVVTVGDFARACAASNPRFDRKRFLTACDAIDAPELQ
jgi:hypothetical protein